MLIPHPFAWTLNMMLSSKSKSSIECVDVGVLHVPQRHVVYELKGLEMRERTQMELDFQLLTNPFSCAVWTCAFFPGRVRKVSLTHMQQQSAAAWCECISMYAIVCIQYMWYDTWFRMVRTEYKEYMHHVARDILLSSGGIATSSKGKKSLTKDPQYILQSAEKCSILMALWGNQAQRQL